MKKVIGFLLIIASLFCFFEIKVSAAADGDTQRRLRIYLYEEYNDCVFFINWENKEQEAVVKVKSPDDVIVNTDPQSTEYGKGFAMVNVGAAKSGYWTIVVTGSNLGTINVSGGSKSSISTQHNIIQSFNAEFVNDRINFKWNVATEQDTVSVNINAVGRYSHYTIWNDYDTIKNGTASISADKLSTGLYFFNIEVYDGNSQYTLSINEPIYVKQLNAPEKLNNVKVGGINGEIYAVWDNFPSDCYEVIIYDYDTLNVIKEERVYENFYYIPADEQTDKYKFSVAAVDGNNYGDFDVFEVICSDPVGTVTFPDYSSTRKSVVTINIDCPENAAAGVYLDNTLLLEDAMLGNYDLNLSEGEHEIVAFIKDENGNMKTFSKILNVDKTPPAINITNTEHTVTSSDSIVINGNTEPNAVVSINGIEQELGANGFMAKILLKNGTNPITITAYDTAGNKSCKTIVVEKTNSLSHNWFIYIIAAIIFVLLTIWYIFLNRKKKEVPLDEENH